MRATETGLDSERKHCQTEKVSFPPLSPHVSFSHQHTHRHTKLKNLLVGLCVPLKHLSIDICLEPGSSSAPALSLSSGTSDLLCNSLTIELHVTPWLEIWKRCILRLGSYRYILTFRTSKPVTLPVYCSKHKNSPLSSLDECAYLCGGVCVGVNNTSHFFLPETSFLWPVKRCWIFLGATFAFQLAHSRSV